MIPSRQEVLYRLYGTLRLARFDPAGAQYFDESPEAAARSFFAAALVTPAYFFINLMAPAEATGQREVTIVTILAMFLVYSLSWTVFPVIAFHICRTIDREQAFFRYLSANNWSRVLTYHLGLVLFVLLVGGTVPPGFVALLTLAGAAFLIGYSWFIARCCLNISPAGAAGFLVLQIMVEFCIMFFAGALLG
jgi:hypothetical protein